MRVIFLAIIAIFPALSMATSARIVDLKELQDLSQLVVVGSSVSRQSFWEGSRIYTRVDVKVEQVWHGTLQVNSTIPVKLLGGVLNNVGQSVAGEPTLPQGRRFVLCLVESKGFYYPVGMWQGIFNIKETPTGEAVQPSGVESGHLGPRLDRLPVDLRDLRGMFDEARRAP